MKSANFFLSGLLCRYSAAGLVMCTVFLFCVSSVQSQCQPYIKIDGNQVLANQTIPAGLQLPMWLKEDQTLAASSMVNSISVLEFTVNGSSLEFTQVLSVANSQTVPAGKVWKIESISKQPGLTSAFGATYSSPGTYTFTVPSCAEQICVEVWGAGGNGGGTKSGGGGGYGQECFTVTPGSSHTVTVAGGGSGGTTSVGSLISATSGLDGPSGNGGTSTAAVNVAGGNGSSTRGGTSGCGPNCSGGTGGNAGTNNDCCNGSTGVRGGNGVSPGGGGGMGWYNCCNGQNINPGSGADGKVVITW